MKKMGRGSDDILPAPADWAPAYRTGVACHMRKCGKPRTQTSLIWQSCKCHSKSDNWMRATHNNGKNIKAPIAGGWGFGGREALIGHSEMFFLGP